jgi:anti-sigma B factor antagonist
MPLTISSRVDDDVIVLDLVGKLWVLDLPLRNKVNELMKDGYRQFVLSIPGVDYCDSSGLGQIVSIWSSIKSKGGHMTVLKPANRVQKLFEMTKLNVVLEIFEDEGDAIKHSRNRS